MSGVAARSERAWLLPFPGRPKEFTLSAASVSRCAGLDVHKRVMVATVRLDQTDGQVVPETRPVSGLRRDRAALCRWLQGGAVEVVVMESTGHEWKSL
jgi:hypothetical protein